MIAAASLVALAAASSAFASPMAKRADGLKVDIASPAASLKSVDGLKFTASVTNTGSEEVKVLKYGTVLDSLPTRSFTVTKDGSAVDFQGVKVSVDLTEKAYTTIPAGETVTVEHDLSSLYNFANVGAGKFDFVPNTDFKAAGVAASKVKEDSITIEIADVAAKRSFTRKARSEHARALGKRAVVECGDSSQGSFIEASYSEGQSLAALGSEYVASGGSLYDAYFSTNSASSVTGVLDAVASESDASRTLSCTDDYNVCDGNVIAYTLIATTDIYYCDIFFDEVATEELCGGVTVNDRVIRGGTTLHELSHAVADTDDVTYGCPADQALSASQQLINADNYNCFTTAVFAETQC